MTQALLVAATMLLADVLGTVTTAAIAHGHVWLAMPAHGLTDVLNSFSMLAAGGGMAAGVGLGLTVSGGLGMFAGSLGGVAIGMTLSAWLERQTGVHVPHRFRPRWPAEKASGA